MLERVWRKGNTLFLEKRERSCGNVNWYSHYGRQYGDSLKTRNKTTIWPSNSTPRNTPWANQKWKRHMYPTGYGFPCGHVWMWELVYILFPTYISSLSDLIHSHGFGLFFKIIYFWLHWVVFAVLGLLVVVVGSLVIGLASLVGEHRL